MPPKTPQFWQRKDGLAKWLRPFSWIYLACHKFNMWRVKPYKSSLPVVCVGGAIAGGSGKTPIVHSLMALIREEEIFYNPVILTRGYGGALKGPTLVDLAAHTAEDVGDEALLHATRAPTIVSRNRMQGALLAEAMGADAIIMDDGLQNNSLAKDVSILVIDRKYGVGNGYVLPAGPLREPLDRIMVRCDLVIHTDTPDIVSTHDKTLEYLGFAGLAYPEKFKHTLEQNGFILTGFEFFADHHPYTEKDIERLKQSAKGAMLITTEKDFVKIPVGLRDSIDVVRISHPLPQREDILSLLKKVRIS